MDLKILYRLSDKGRPKPKLPEATKEGCLKNAISVFGKERITLFADNCEDDTLRMIKAFGIEPIPISLGNSGSWRFVAEYAFEHFDDDQVVYFLEDDYIHLNKSMIYIKEGIRIADYVTLYDHPDKYDYPDESRPFKNKQVKEGGEPTRVILTDSTHWKLTSSTTMTFACRVSTLKEDYSIWHKFTAHRTPKDNKAFKGLRGRGNIFNRIFGKKRIIISPIPSISTHAEVVFLAPLVDWSKV